MKRSMKIKRYVTNVVVLVILTAAAVFLFLGRVSPKAVRDKTKRMHVLGGELNGKSTHKRSSR
jgi:VIT1/CCC1 family predicted Fe2+/Mn2+ transporter